MPTNSSPVAEKSMGDAMQEDIRPKAPAHKGTERLVSLDVFRGFTMFWIVGGGMLMVGLAACGHNFVIDGIVRQLEHSRWFGLHFYDCIWPSFMLMVGVSVPLSLAKRSLTERYSVQLTHAIQRAVVLFLYRFDKRIDHPRLALLG